MRDWEKKLQQNHERSFLKGKREGFVHGWRSIRGLYYHFWKQSFLDSQYDGLEEDRDAFRKQQDFVKSGRINRQLDAIKAEQKMLVRTLPEHHKTAARTLNEYGSQIRTQIGQEELDNQYGQFAEDIADL